MAGVLTMMIAMNTDADDNDSHDDSDAGDDDSHDGDDYDEDEPLLHPSPDTMPPGRWWRSWSSSRSGGTGTPAGPTLLRR